MAYYNEQYYSSKPIPVGTVVKVHEGIFDTHVDIHLYKDRLGIIYQVNPTAGSYNPMYDVAMVDENYNYTYLEQRLAMHTVRRAGLRLSSSKYDNLNKLVTRVKGE